jgi:alpha-L-rhamnosidase
MKSINIVSYRHRFVTLLVSFGWSVWSFAASPEEAFRNPSETAKPGVWWHWMGSNVSVEGITQDLEEFKKAGISGATIFGMADVSTPWAGHIENSPNDGLLAFTDPWWKLVRHAAAEGKRLGLDVGLHNCPGYTSTGGPWVTPELSMQEIFQSQTVVEGGSVFRGVVPKPVVDPRGNVLFPMINKQTGVLEKPIIEARKSYWRDIAVLAVPAEGVIAKEQVIDLTAKMAADGALEWTPPAGNWVIYRFGHTTMGALTQPNQWEIMGLECDKMSEKAVEFHLGHVIGKLKEHLGPLVGTGLKHMLLDSYEAGTPSWTPQMPQEFSARRGYDLTAFLPTFAGRVVGSDGETEKFRGDFSRTIADLYRDVLFVTMARVLEKENLRFVCEPYGGPFHTGEVAPHVHRVMTEFWSGDAFSPNSMDGIFKAGEGKRHNILEAEAFTGSPDRSQWTETPALLKQVGDGAFCAGINRFILHTNPHQPWNAKIRPGMTMGQWGTHFGRTQTWWEPGKAWLAYLARCQALLQWEAPAPQSGFSVSDAAAGLTIQGIHRSDGAAHVFFIANTSQAAGSAVCTFQVGGMTPELWDPVTATMRPLTDFQSSESTTRLTLDFAPAQSCFVVFRKAGAKPEPLTRNFPMLNEATKVAGPWKVSFDPDWGGPEKPVDFVNLDDWTSRPEVGIRYYSGTAVYRTIFDAPQEENTTPFLDLGTVRHLARVRLNGQDLGVVWCAPWGVHVPAGLLKSSGNRLEIAVTNVWANRLIGDEQEPADCEWQPGHMGNGGYLKRFPDWFVKGQERPSPGRNTFTTWNYYNRNSQPVSSGLLGPVRVMAAGWKQEQSSLTGTANFR